ncbi:hypothetical protein DPV78_000178 [Talaromyces pinophilus]|nr:hypothetical protein DPV78_000178 [Talaromyces pinophilus]
MSFYECTFLDAVQMLLITFGVVVMILLFLSLFSLLIPDPYSIFIFRLQYLVIDTWFCIVLASLFIVSDYSVIITEMSSIWLPMITVLAWFTWHQFNFIIELERLWIELYAWPWFYRRRKTTSQRTLLPRYHLCHSFAILRYIAVTPLLYFAIFRSIAFAFDKTEKVRMLPLSGSPLFPAFLTWPSSVYIASILRITTLNLAASHLDVTWNSIGSSMWTVIEANLGIFCASLPAFRSALASFFPTFFGRNRATAYYQSTQS